MFGKNAWEKTEKVAFGRDWITARGQSPMRASICFAPIRVVLLKIKERIHFEYVNVKHSYQFEAKVKKHNFHIWIFR